MPLNSSVGIGKAIENKRKKVDDAKNLTSQAVNSLQDLLNSTDRLLALVTRYGDKPPDSLFSLIGGFDAEEDEEELDSLEGIVSQILKSNGGYILSLTDLYCVVNTIRTTEPISVKRLLREAEKLRNFDLVELKSGTKIVVSKKVGPIVERFVQDNIENVGYVTARLLGNEIGTSSSFAQEFLERLESVGNLVRDVTLFETRFYKNIF
eukprot:augustus_masked-scaffold_12-processed-gene-6.55-mRNA-1 protein AED:1.00 eAED:1.00 QI:0/-1/0/0/-1/1/1/0/207